MKFLKFLGIIFCSFALLALALICPFTRNAMPEPVKDAVIAVTFAIALNAIGFSGDSPSSDPELSSVL